ncbi:hypothetical protein BSKO_11915 [Bryopsis sp. KO-2023]|nr:hypothetical protein BSKO_11915 [Bryopsis sp. KO-2023]
MGRRFLISLLTVFLAASGIGCDQEKVSISKHVGDVKVDEDKGDFVQSCKCYDVRCDRCLSRVWVVVAIIIILLGVCGAWACSFTSTTGGKYVQNVSAEQSLHRNNSSTVFPELEPLLVRPHLLHDPQ